MASRIFNGASRLLALTLCAFAIRVPLWAQTATIPVVHSRCSKVFLASETPLAPVRLIEPYLQKREEFKASKLVLTEEEGSSDVIVRLRRNGERGTSVLVVNLWTGEHAVGSSPWTDYPSMIAPDVMNEIRRVCPGSIVPPPTHRRVLAEDRGPIPTLGTISKIAPCPHTSWMDERDLSRALGSSVALKRWSIQVVPTCDPTGARLEVTHNLEQTVEWHWKLKSAEGETVTYGRVIAFTGRDAAQRIANSLVREIGLSRGDSAGDTTAIGMSSTREQIPTRTVAVKIMPTDFSTYDTRIALSIDSERISARDLNGRLLFSFRTEDLRDVRHTKAWDPMFPLADPTGLIALADSAGDPWSELSYTEGLIGHFALGVAVAPFKTPVHILDLVWEEDGQLKTLSLQVPSHESGRLLRAFRAVMCADPSQACGEATESAASKP
jgi:hypothetical protein